MIRFCKIPVGDLTQEVFDSTINDSVDSCIINQQEQVAVVCWEGTKPTALYGREEISQEELAALVLTKNNGWTTPFEVSISEAKQLPDEILSFLSYDDNEIAFVRNAE